MTLFTFSNLSWPCCYIVIYINLLYNYISNIVLPKYGRYIYIYVHEGHSKSSKTNSKKTSEYGNQIESCKYSHLIWLPYS